MFVSVWYIAYYIAFITTLIVQTVYSREWFIPWIVLIALKFAGPIALAVYQIKVVKRYLTRNFENKATITRFIHFLVVETAEAICLALMLAYMWAQDMSHADFIAHLSVFGLLMIVNLPIKMDYVLFRIVRWNMMDDRKRTTSKR